MEERITRDALNIEIARLYSMRSTCGRLHVGAVIVKEGRVISTGYNGSVKGDEHCIFSCDKDTPCTKAVHAEMNAILFAARYGVAIEGCSIYCTHSPCPTCAKAIVQAGITEVVYLEEFRDTEALKYLKRLKITVRKHEVKI